MIIFNLVMLVEVFSEKLDILPRLLPSYFV